MTNRPISITAISSISALGCAPSEVWQGYQTDAHHLSRDKNGTTFEWVARLPKTAKDLIIELQKSEPKFKHLDDSVLYAIFVARRAIAAAGWKRGDHFGINLGSSRGATALFEKHHETFLIHGRTDTLASPTTTLGNISSWVAHDLQAKGPEISHSITCSTALHALMNGVAWIGSGMADKFLVGGSEAALTPFTLAQMKALKIYAQLDSDYPCRSLDLNKDRNTMVLGEGAALACLELGLHDTTLAVIEGLGYATEPLAHNVSISTDAECFQRSMKMALGQHQPEDVDVLVAHAPGTIKGDLSEFRAIQKVFGSRLPLMTTNKWKIGHTFGASGLFGIEMAILMMEHQHFIKIPFLEYGTVPRSIQRVMVNAVGFGGNAVSILLKAPSQH
ncbi:MAG: beta-ketoacyl synthase N-terminal-like domain-containing protein [Flavobacteriaceae bacterium]